MKAFPHHQEWVSALDCLTPKAPHLAIICPRDHAKTEWMAKMHSAYAIGRNPNIHVGLIAHAAERANTLSLAVRDVVSRSPEYKEVFPEVSPDMVKGWARNKWYVQREDVGDKEPTFLASGAFGPVLGSRFDLVVMDDIQDQESAASELQRKKIIEWVKQTLKPCVVPGGHIVLCMTRWHEEDLVSAFLNDPEWNIVHMPAIGYWGENLPLWPERHSLDELLKIKREDPVMFEGMYQGNPHVPEGQLIKRSWWRWANLDSFPSFDSFDMLIQAWDTAFKTGEDNDYSVCITAGRFQGQIYLLDVFRKKMEWPELLRASRTLFGKYQPRAVLIEDSASGQSLLQSLRLDAQPMIPVIPSKRGDSDTEAFVKSKTGWIEGGRVWLPKGLDWTQPFINEAAAFPRGKDDQVLALAHLLKYMTAGIDSPPLDDSMFVRGSRQFETGSEEDIKIEGGSDSNCSFSFGREHASSWRDPWTN